MYPANGPPYREEDFRPAVGMPRHRRSTALCVAAAAFLVALGGFLAGLQVGTENESRRWHDESRRMHALEHALDLVRDVPGAVERQGELWLKCPGTSTWYNCGQPRKDRPRRWRSLSVTDYDGRVAWADEP